MQAAPVKTPLGSGAIVALVATILGVVLIAAPPLWGAAPLLQRTAGTVVIALALWATGAVPAYFGAIVFLFLAMALALAPARVVFSGFHSSAVWLVFGGLIVGAAVQQSGLGARVVRAMLAHFPASYGGLIWAIALVGAGLAFFIPSAVGRVMLLMPIVFALAERLGFGARSNGRTGLILAAGFSTTIPPFAILPANVPNMGLIGAAESIYGVSLTYGTYLLLNFPIIGIFGVVALPLLIVRLFPDTPKPISQESDHARWSAAERKLMLVVSVALALWITDFLHHIAPAWVALGAAVLCMIPRLGVVPPTTMAKTVDYGPWFFVAGIIGLGAVVDQTGLGKAIARAFLDYVPFVHGAGFANFAAMYAMGLVVGVMTTLPASPGVMTPFAQSIADATGWPLLSVLMMQVPAWMLFPFAYQAPPIITTIVMGGIAAGAATRLLLAYTILGILIALPLQYFWGKLLGFYL
ncbi:MAG: SLC13 family permease [Alphaproteobacteria bacterium]